MATTPRVGASSLLRDVQLAEVIDQIGFATVGRLYHDEAVAELVALYRAGMARLGRPVGDAWLPTALLEDHQVRTLFWDGIRSVARRCFVDLLDPGRAEVFGGEFAIKPASPASGIGFHQGFSLVDEDRFVSLDTWSPLIDATVENGTLRLVPGTHLLPNTPHLSVAPGSFGEAEDQLVRCEQVVKARAGEVVLFDTRMVHRSLPNLSSGDRVAVRALIRPTESPLLFYFADHETPEGEVEIYEVDDRFYVDQGVFTRPSPESARVVGLCPRTELTGRALIDAWGSVPDVGRTDEFDDGGEPEPGTGLFTDPDVQSRFERDGYVVIPLLDPEEVADLTRLFEDLHPSFDNGFHSSQESDDPEYRDAVATNVLCITERAVRTSIDRARAVAAGMLIKSPVKSPDEGARIAPHQDWTMVDEARFASALVWCPLVDTDDENGMLSVVAGSHRLGPTWRGRDLPQPYEGLEEEIVAHHLTPVPCRAGEAVVFDSRLLHASPPNRSEHVRPVAAVGVVPAAAPLLHFDMDERGRVHRHSVAEDFFRRVSVYNGGLPPTLSTNIVDLRLPKFEAYQLPRPPAQVEEEVVDTAETPAFEEELTADIVPALGPNVAYAALPGSLRSAARAGWSVLPSPVRSVLRPGLRSVRRLLTFPPRTVRSTATTAITSPPKPEARSQR